MELQNLQAFISVSETGSFSRAAEKLFLTQPAVSKRIHALEQQLNVRLFDRIGKTVQLTEAGAALLPGCRRILAELDESRRIIQNLSGHVSGPLKLGTSHHIGLHRLPNVLRHFIQHYPQVDLDIHFMDSEEAMEAVLKGELELAIATLPDKPPPNLSTRLIWHDPLGITVAKDHVLSQLPQVDLKRLMQYPAILPSQGTFTRALLEKKLRIDSSRFKIAMETNYLETIKMMVSIGLGWSVLPLSMCDRHLVSLNTRGMIMERQLGVAWHHERTLSNAALKMLDILDGFRQQ